MAPGSVAAWPCGRRSRRSTFGRGRVGLHPRPHAGLPPRAAEQAGSRLVEHLELCVLLGDPELFERLGLGLGERPRCRLHPLHAGSYFFFGPCAGRRRSCPLEIAQTTLRSVLGQHSLDELLSERDKINAILQEIIDGATAPWGIKISIVEVKDVEIPQGMQRAMARQAEAERERRAKVIAAEGEAQASERLKDAANVLSENPISIQLRYLQTMLEISSERSSMIILPLPLDLVRPLIEMGDRARSLDRSKDGG